MNVAGSWNANSSVSVWAVVGVSGVSDVSSGE